MFESVTMNNWDAQQMEVLSAQRMTITGESFAGTLDPSRAKMLTTGNVEVIFRVRCTEPQAMIMFD